MSTMKECKRSVGSFVYSKRGGEKEEVKRMSDRVEIELNYRQTEGRLGVNEGPNKEQVNVQ